MTTGNNSMMHLSLLASVFPAGRVFVCSCTCYVFTAPSCCAFTASYKCRDPLSMYSTFTPFFNTHSPCLLLRSLDNLRKRWWMHLLMTHGWTSSCVPATAWTSASSGSSFLSLLRFSLTCSAFLSPQPVNSTLDLR